MYDDENRLRMWYRYAPCGVAIRSEYGRLKSALNGFIDVVHLGQVRYGDEDMTGYNALQTLFTKRPDYRRKNEVRAVVCSYDPVGGQSRNYWETNFPHREPQDDLNPPHPWVNDSKRRRIHLKDLVTSISGSPWMGEETYNKVQQNWAKIRDYQLQVAYDLNSTLTPKINELRQRGWGKPGLDWENCQESAPRVE